MSQRFGDGMWFDLLFFFFSLSLIHLSAFKTRRKPAWARTGYQRSGEEMSQEITAAPPPRTRPQRQAGPPSFEGSWPFMCSYPFLPG